ncbi:lipoyl(octanoyl) transferase [Flexibacter flexilis DSM 6793]|uniref:Octanoyltransferase n=1 Tax=Flexibacter flexilis DSM 6793 TaxID=927664 RepID=A0A1I1DRR0_9BACT|nr:lipoyl(octanoyl) transferase LipB [Flexibacter flexilis]SFB75380.1 lipoyl(octanoyl) transferase [Flexibacter flexilis DSM 6793]
MQNKNIIFQDLGEIAYGDAWAYQDKLFNQIIEKKIANRTAEQPVSTENYLLFCQHPHVYTLGKSGDAEHLLIGQERLEQIGATYFKINRGGDITYHGPGQLVGYPIIDLDNFFTDIHKYLRFIEEAIILTLNDYGLKAGRIEGLTGVWIENRKICAIGVRSSRWVTMHGFALNVNTNLDYFGYIVPCGIQDKAVTSLVKELGRAVSMEEVAEKIRKHFATLFEASIV